MKIAIIGYGGMGNNHRKYIIPRLNDSDYPEKLEIAGIYDISEERRAFASELGLHCFNSAEEIWKDESIKIVLVSTPNDLHKPYVIEALSRGKNVIVEKPMGLDSEEVKEMYAAAEKYGKVFAVHQNRRWDDDYLTIKNIYDKNIVGRTYLIESRVMGSNGIPGAWRKNAAQGGGMMLDWGVHLIDQIMYMVDEKVTNVFCKMYSINYPEVDDNLRLTMTFESGLTAHIEVSTNNFISHPRWYVLGKDGTLQIDDWACGGRVVKCLERQHKWADEIQTIKAGPTKTMAPRSPETVETIPLSEPTDVEDNLDVVYRQLVDAIEGKAELTIKPEQALRVMKVMEAAFESSETGNAIHLNI